MENIYLPKMASIVSTRPEIPDVKTFSFRFLSDFDQETFHFQAGQFIELSVFGVGEAPLSISSSPSRRSSFQCTVKAVGSVTDALHRMKEGDIIGIRGPFGNGFPFIELLGLDILFVGGGIGLAPLRSLIVNMLDNRSDFGKITLLYGARTPSELLFKEDLAVWEQLEGFQVLTTVDRADETWQGNVGVVTTLLSKVKVDPSRTVAFVCGPPVMFRFAIAELQRIGLSDDQIISTLERYMKCGVGKCGHCCISHKYVCQDGPVFSYDEIKTLQEEI